MTPTPEEAATWLEPGALGGLATDPQSRAALWAWLQATLLRPDGLVPRTTKELAALATFGAARLEPLTAALQGSLEQRGLSGDVLADLVERGQSSRLPRRTQDLIAFQVRAALDPALLGEPDRRRLRQHGVSAAGQRELVAAGSAVALLITLGRGLEPR